jgi:hypothetical protein
MNPRHFFVFAGCIATLTLGSDAFAQTCFQICQRNLVTCTISANTDAKSDACKKQSAACEQSCGGGGGSSPSSGGGNNPPGRPSDPKSCIDANTLPHQTAWSVTNFKNTCDGSVTFDYDDCDQDANLQQQCKVKTATISGHSSLRVDNYKREPVARNFR